METFIRNNYESVITYHVNKAFSFLKTRSKRFTHRHFICNNEGKKSCKNSELTAKRKNYEHNS